MATGPKGDPLENLQVARMVEEKESSDRNTDLRQKIEDIEARLNSDSYKSKEEKAQLEKELLEIEDALRSEEGVVYEAKQKEADEGKIESLKEEVKAKRGELEGTEAEIDTPEKGFRDKTLDDNKIESDRLEKERDFRISENELHLYETGKIDLIRNAGSIEELLENMDELKGLNGTQGHYEADNLKALIQEVANGNIPPQFVTRTAGLREKVINLVEKRAEENPEEQKFEVIKLDETKKEEILEVTEPLKEETEDFFAFFNKMIAVNLELEMAQRKYFKSVKKASLLKKVRNFLHLGDGIDSETVEIEELVREKRGEFSAALLEYSKYVAKYKDDEVLLSSVEANVTKEVQTYNSYLKVLNERTETRTIVKKPGMFLPLLAAAALGFLGAKALEKDSEAGAPPAEANKATAEWVVEDKDEIDWVDDKTTPAPVISGEVGGKEDVAEVVEEKKGDEVKEAGSGTETQEIPETGAEHVNFFKELHDTEYNSESDLDQPKMDIIKILEREDIMGVSDGKSLPSPLFDHAAQEVAGGKDKVEGWQKVRDALNNPDILKKVKDVYDDVEDGLLDDLNVAQQEIVDALSGK